MSLDLSTVTVGGLEKANPSLVEGIRTAARNEAAAQERERCGLLMKEVAGLLGREGEPNKVAALAAAQIQGGTPLAFGADEDAGGALATLRMRAESLASGAVPLPRRGGSSRSEGVDLSDDRDGSKHLEAAKRYKAEHPDATLTEALSRTAPGRSR
jgi:hypothetical protein